MFYWITNGSAIAVIFGFSFIAFAIEKFSFDRFTVKNITIIGVLCALSVVLTNVVGYSRIFGFQIMIGNFVIFLAGMALGPLVGIVTGIVTDSVGALINLSGTFHAGFMLIKVLYGVLGSAVFMWKTNRWWILKTAGLMTLAVTIGLFAISPISLWSMGFPNGYVYASMIRKIILTPLEIVIYTGLTIPCFRVIWIFLKNNHDPKYCAWVARHGDFRFIVKQQQSELLKLQEKQKYLPKKLQKIKTN